jgi:hypothetical protein
MIFLPFAIEKSIFPGSYGPFFVPPNSCTPTKSNLYLANSLATVISAPDLYMLLTFHVPKLMSLFLRFHVPKLMSLFHSWGRTKESVQVWGFFVCFVT